MLAGTFRKDRAPTEDVEFKLASGVPDRPEWLTGEAAVEWDLLVADPGVARVLAKADRLGLAALCDALSTWRAAAKILASEGLTMSFEKGEGSGLYSQQRPEVSIAHQSRKQVMDFLREFGLTPSSRSKVSGPAGLKKASDGWDEF